LISESPAGLHRWLGPGPLSRKHAPGFARLGRGLCRLVLLQVPERQSGRIGSDFRPRKARKVDEKHAQTERLVERRRGASVQHDKW